MCCGFNLTFYFHFFITLLRYYLERKLFEELYDLKRYQIRTGKSNEPQTVKRLVEKFRRDVLAPGMSDFKGPYSYRAYEMFLYGEHFCIWIYY